VFENPFEIVFLQKICRGYPVGAERIFTAETTAYKMPRAIFFVFKGTTGAANQETPTQCYQFCKHANMKKLIVKIDEMSYPARDQNCDYSQNSYTAFYQEFVEISKEFGGDCSLGYKAFKDLYSIYTFDLMKRTGKDVNKCVVNFMYERQAVPNDNTGDPRELFMYMIIYDQRVFKVNARDGIVEEIF